MPVQPRPRSVLLVIGALLLAGCTADPAPEESPAPVRLSATVADPRTSPLRIDTEDPVRTAIRMSKQVFGSSSLVVLSTPDEANLTTAASLAVAAGVPLLVDGEATGDDDPLPVELDRLGATHAITVGEVRGLDDLAASSVTDPTALDGLLDLGKAESVSADAVIDAVSALDRPDTAVLTLDPGPSTGTGDEPRAEPSGEPRPSSSSEPRPDGTDRTAGAEDTTDAAWLEAATLDTDHTAPAHTVVLTDPLADDDPRAMIPALATARAAGIPVVEVPGGDPRATSETVRSLTGVVSALALGPSFGSTERLTPRVESAATGVELPGGGQLVFPRGDHLTGKKYVALYGTPGTPALGVLGEQDVPGTIARAEETARGYRALTDDTVIPTLEIIATIASSGPEADGSYSRPRSIDDLRPLIEAAADAGQAVVIDLQPGRTDFLTQAQQYAELLAYPNVGLALDPEWRLKPDQVHLRQIGSVSVDEVNQVSDWLAQFVRDHDLPQKMFLLHQFSLRMITDRDRLDVSHDELATIIHADGQGSQPAKTGTWNTLRQGAPDVHWGWKNFYDEDQPMLTPEQTYQVSPVPDLVTYQ